jgi:HEAT repeats
MSIPADPVLVELLERATGEALSGSARESELFWSTVADAVAAVPVDEVIAVAITFCRSDAPAMRATGAGMLAELCNLAHEWAGEALADLGPLLAREDETDVIRVALHGVALTVLPEAIPMALGFVAHGDASVRLDATHALYSCAGDPASAEAIDALIALSSDTDDAVRDWATFGLGTHVATDDDHVRSALVARLSDPYLDAREEAAVGLARRGDARALEPVLELLEADEVSSLAVEAAGHLADERLLRPLLELGEWWEDDSDLLRLAIARCDPVARARVDERTRLLVELVERGFAGSVPAGTLDEVTAKPSFLELASELTVTWTDGDGIRREALWTIERVLARHDVRDDPERAAAAVLATIPGALP